MFTTWIPFNLFVVATRLDCADHHGLRTTTSPHLVTLSPQGGDVIVAVISGRQEIGVREDGSWIRSKVEIETRGSVERHAGRSASLGEDGIEDAFGGDGLSEIVPEVVSGASWRYAPCAYEAFTEDSVACECADAMIDADGDWCAVIGAAS